MRLGGLLSLAAVPNTQQKRAKRMLPNVISPTLATNRGIDRLSRKGKQDERGRAYWTALTRRKPREEPVLSVAS